MRSTNRRILEPDSLMKSLRANDKRGFCIAFYFRGCGLGSDVGNRHVGAAGQAGDPQPQKPGAPSRDRLA
jgi:hypothetical protein